MAYFVTGATGFIGSRLVGRLLQRDGTIYVLVRKSSKDKVDALRERWGDDDERIVAVEGDLTQPGLGVSDKDVAALKGKVRHFMHLAAIYDMQADA